MSTPLARISAGYRPPIQHQHHGPFDFLVGLQSCHRCGAYPVGREKLDLVPAPAGETRYSQVYVHRGGCPA